MTSVRLKGNTDAMRGAKPKCGSLLYKGMIKRTVFLAFALCVARAGFASFGPGDAESYRAAGIVDDDTVAFLTLDDTSLSSGMVLTNFAYGAHKQTAKLGINTGIVTQPGTGGDLPGTGVRRLASLDDNIFENTGYIHFQTNLNAQKSGCVYVSDTDYDLFGGASFTIEGFHRFNEPPGGEDAKATQYVLGRHASQWNLLASINGTKLKFQHWHNEIDGIVTNSISSSGTSTTVVRDGCWHHLAYVYDGDAQTATLYVDYQKQVTLQNVQFPACEVKYSDYLMIGSAYYATSSAYQANSLDLDEVRITRRVLATHEFLASEYVANAGKTLFWTGFEEDTVADVAPWPYLTMRSKCTLPSSKSPTISDEVPFSVGVKDDRGVLREENRHALQIIKGGYLTWKDDLLLQHRNFDKLTLELFAKSTDAAGGTKYGSVADFTGSNAAGSAYTNVLIALQVSNTNVTFRGHMNNDKGNQHAMSICSSTNSTVPAVLTDGRWHHVALVIEETAASKIEMSGYYDYKLISTSTANIGIRDMLTTSGIKIGGGFNGYLDEVRLTADALTPSQFLKAGKGIVVIVR